MPIALQRASVVAPQVGEGGHAGLESHHGAADHALVLRPALERRARLIDDPAGHDARLGLEADLSLARLVEGGAAVEGGQAERDGGDVTTAGGIVVGVVADGRGGGRRRV